MLAKEGNHKGMIRDWDFDEFKETTEIKRDMK